NHLLRSSVHLPAPSELVVASKPKSMTLSAGLLGRFLVHHAAALVVEPRSSTLALLFLAGAPFPHRCEGNAFLRSGADSNGPWAGPIALHREPGAFADSVPLAELIDGEDSVFL